MRERELMLMNDIKVGDVMDLDNRSESKVVKH